MLYSIPSYIKIQSLNANNFLQLSPAHKNAVAVLKDKNCNRDFLINETTRRFIEKFKTAKDFITVNKEIAIEAGTTEDAVKPYTEPFFNHLKKAGFIINTGSGNLRKRKTRFNKNKVLGSYIIEKNLALTSTMDVYVAKQKSFAKQVVIKLLKQADEEKISQFKREYNFLLTLNNSGVTPVVFDFSQEKNCCWFAQEYVKGFELNEYLNAHSNMRLQSFIKVASAIIYGFKIIHSRHIVHGDIHPANIFITSSKQAKIIDFGLALNQKLESNELVKYGGAYFYMPPERINQTTHNKFVKQPDFYSDVFQIGVVLYTMLYNQYPFNGIIWEELALEIKEKEAVFEDISVYGFIVPGWLKSLVQKCLAKKAEQRFYSAVQLYKAFQKNNV